MLQLEPKKVLGVYSDSGLNDIEISLIETDGLDIYGDPISILRPYPPTLKENLFQFILKQDYTNTALMMQLDKELTDFHIEVIADFIEAHPDEQFDLIGYSGHTVYHKPKDKVSISLGNSQRIADETHIPVVSKFIQSDLRAGGVGGPLLCSFYDAMTRTLDKPLAILSLGGVTTLMFIGAFGEMQAFDIGIGTVLLDHWIYKKTGAEMDFNGAWATRGQVDQHLLNHLLKEPFLHQNPPKTADKNEFIDLYEQVEGSGTADGATTLTHYIAQSIAQARSLLKQQPKQWILVGGGVYNPVLVRLIKGLLKENNKIENVVTAFNLEWQNETLSAQAYAFLAARSLMGLPISFPESTGVQEPTTGGKLFTPEKKAP